MGSEVNVKPQQFCWLVIAHLSVIFVTKSFLISAAFFLREKTEEYWIFYDDFPQLKVFFSFLLLSNSTSFYS